MRYNDTIKYLQSLEKFGIKLGLKNIRTLSKLLGEPHKALKAIHVAGTNGKGSVAAMIGNILEHAGYRVGVYTSPHLSRFTERITINGKEISEDKVVEATNTIKTFAERTAEITGGHPTFFEFTTAMMFKYFKEEHVDFAVLEVGMGGRLDATNIVSPLVSVITNVTLEHTQYLGKTVEKIAFEKAGIIKRKVPVVTAVDAPRALSVIKNICKKRECELFTAGKEVKFRAVNHNLNGQSLEVSGLSRQYKNIFIPLLGKHQIVNAATAIASIELLQKNYSISREAIRKGLANVKWPGRLEIVKKKPLIILDCAHNPGAAKTLRTFLEKFSQSRKIILVIGISSDKDILAIVSELAPISELVIATRSKVIDRAADAEYIAKEILNYKTAVTIVKNVNSAVEHAISLAGMNDIICITGSIFVVGEARDWLLHKKKL